MEDSIFADNGLNIDLERNLSPPIRLLNITIIGETTAYHTNARYKNLGEVCSTRDTPNTNVGIEIRTWKNEVGTTGSIWENIRFSGFNHNSCRYSSPIALEYTIRDGHLMFDYFTTMKSLVFQDADTNPIDFRRAEKGDVLDVYSTDLDGRLKPSFLSTFVNPSTLISHQPNMLQFVDKSKCSQVASKCFSHCQDTCFRGNIFVVDPSYTLDYRFKICQKTNMTNCFISWGFRRAQDPYYSHRYRYFPAYMPIGSYEAVFIDVNNNEVWPSFVRQLNSDNLCPKTGIHTVTMKEPPVTYNMRSELIRNGNVEASPVDALYWMTQGRGLGYLKLLQGTGVDGSNALSSVKNDTRTIIVQYLDTRCLKLMKNQEYLLSGKTTNRHK